MQFRFLLFCFFLFSSHIDLIDLEQKVIGVGKIFFFEDWSFKHNKLSEFLKHWNKLAVPAASQRNHRSDAFAQQGAKTEWDLKAWTN